MKSALLRAVPPRVSIIEGLSYEEKWARRDVITLYFQQRCRTKNGRGCWRDWATAGSRRARMFPYMVDLAIPPVARWTPDTLSQVIAIMREQLRQRGATGKSRISVVADAPLVSDFRVFVRIGNLRADTLIDAGTVRYEVPHEVVYALHKMAPNAALNWAVRSARDRDEEA